MFVQTHFKPAFSHPLWHPAFLDETLWQHHKCSEPWWLFDPHLSRYLRQRLRIGARLRIWDCGDREPAMSGKWEVLAAG